MTSVDSGVETGNDSNDSYATLDSQPTIHEVSPSKPSPNPTLFQSSVNNLDLNKSPGNEQINSSVEALHRSVWKTNESQSSKDLQVSIDDKQVISFVRMSETKDAADSEFRPPLQKIYSSQDSSGIEPPASLTFSLLPDTDFKSNGCGEFSLQRFQRDAVVHRRKMRSKHAWYLGPLDERRLRQASSTNNVDIVATLLSSGVSPNCCDNQGRSPLHLAACRGYCDVVRLLLEKGANPNLRDTLGNTPLHLAACTNNVGVVTMLLKAGTDISSIDHYGRSPLQLAQSKLQLLQRGVANEDSNSVKEEVRQVIEMMLAYLHKRGQEIEAELLGTYTSRLTLSNTREEVETGVRDLLASLASLSIEKSEKDLEKCTDKEMKS